MTTELHHQTVKLSRGAHRTPAHGACVMELASMLAGEPFTDAPRSVSPVIAGYLRAYNDLVDDHRRQDLLPLASEVVGSRGDRATENARARRCMQWGDARLTPWTPSLVTRLLIKRGRALECAGAYAGSAAWNVRRTDEQHAEALWFVRELLGNRHHVPSPAQVLRARVLT